MADAFAELLQEPPRRVFDRWKLRAFRQARGLTQGDLAELCGWIRTSGGGRIRRLERGQHPHKVTKRLLATLSRALSRRGPRVYPRDLTTMSDRLDESQEVYETAELARRSRRGQI